MITKVGNFIVIAILSVAASIITASTCHALKEPAELLLCLSLEQLMEIRINSIPQLSPCTLEDQPQTQIVHDIKLENPKEEENRTSSSS